jgi:hypothetical protein
MIFSPVEDGNQPLCNLENGKRRKEEEMKRR